MSTTRQTVALGLFIGACLLAAAIGSLATASSVGTWYAGIEKPAWTPPGWVFGPVWTVLYIMMGAAAWLVWREGALRDKATAGALTAFGVQLGLNIAWSFIFFGARSPGWAFAEILALLAAIGVTTALFARISTAASALMAPYLVWVVFASVLNFAIWRMNV
ncbi:MAG: tryptophan-rich sensory protein [Phycisphaeraceae bacterium]|nr:MAG: tryptophan-rich sensory protein [Phycisphaeraceae bacterium]